MKNIVIVPNKNKDKNLINTQKIKSFLENKNYNVIIANDYKDQFGNYRYCVNENLAEYIIAIGGDGTFLQAVHDFHFIKNTKFIGINLGTVGFLTTIEMSTYKDQLNELLKNNVQIHKYHMLKITNNHEDFEDSCLNDIVIGRNGFARVIELEIFVNGKNLYKFSGDGVLISTAVGSTAYNLSLGGPIIHPLSGTMVITPIAPHSIGIKPIIVPDSTKIEVKVIGSHKKTDIDAIFTCDGRNNNQIISPGEIITIEKGKEIQNIVLNSFDYFKNLKEKLTT